MSASPFILAQLKANATVEQLVGANIFDSTAPQDTQTPYIVFEEFDGERYSQMGGDANIVAARVRLHLWVSNAADRDTLATACRQALQRFSGTSGGVAVDDVFIIAGGENIFDEVLRAYHGVRDFRVIYRESGPAES